MSRPDKYAAKFGPAWRAREPEKVLAEMARLCQQVADGLAWLATVAEALVNLPPRVILPPSDFDADMALLRFGQQQTLWMLPDSGVGDVTS